ncbi:uncharacterized protein LOC134077935 [Sardina pilchardus]|uniref:uncharacterized protein LOC134077935 n=1 Tax=Sardina pilchardus TaxID=27697 RepID=UPI002E11BC57
MYDRSGWLPEYQSNTTLLVLKEDEVVSHNPWYEDQEQPEGLQQVTVGECALLPCLLPHPPSSLDAIRVYWQTALTDLVVHVFNKGQEEFTHQSPTYHSRTRLFTSQLPIEPEHGEGPQHHPLMAEEEREGEMSNRGEEEGQVEENEGEDKREEINREPYKKQGKNIRLKFNKSNFLVYILLFLFWLVVCYGHDIRVMLLGNV